MNGMTSVVDGCYATALHRYSAWWCGSSVVRDLRGSWNAITNGLCWVKA